MQWDTGQERRRTDAKGGGTGGKVGWYRSIPSNEIQKSLDVLVFLSSTLIMYSVEQQDCESQTFASCAKQAVLLLWYRYMKGMSIE